MKLVPFPSSELPSNDTSMDVDMTMTDSPVIDVDVFQNPLPFHTRLASSVSTDSSMTDSSSDCNSDADASHSRTSKHPLYSRDVHGIYFSVLPYF